MVFKFKVPSPNGENSANWTIIFGTGAAGETNAAAVLLLLSLHLTWNRFLFFLDLPLISPAISNVLSTDFSAMQAI